MRNYSLFFKNCNHSECPSTSLRVCVARAGHHAAAVILPCTRGNPRSGYLNRLLTQLISSLSVSEAGAVRRARALATACARPPSSPTFAGKMYEMMYNEDDSLSGKISFSSGARSASLRFAGCGNAHEGLSLGHSWAGSAKHDRQPR